MKKLDEENIFKYLDYEGTVAVFLALSKHKRHHQSGLFTKIQKVIYQQKNYYSHHPNLLKAIREGMESVEQSGEQPLEIQQAYKELAWSYRSFNPFVYLRTIIKRTSRLEVSWKEKTCIDKRVDGLYILVPVLADSAVLCLIVAHSPTKSSHESISEDNSSHFSEKRWFLLLLIDTILEIHDFNSTHWHFHGIILCHQENFKIIIFLLAIKLGLEVNVDVMRF